VLIPAYLEHLAIGERVAGVPKRQFVILPKITYWGIVRNVHRV
jgi:hypothetical protein